MVDQAAHLYLKKYSDLEEENFQIRKKVIWEDNLLSILRMILE